MKSLFTLTIVFLTFLSSAQTTLAPFLEKDKWGYINPHGEIIIEPQYEKASPFSDDGLAAVMTPRNEWKYINVKNEAIIVSFDRFIPDRNGFNDGLAVIIFNKKKGVINTKGEEVFQAEYDLIYPFSDGYSVARKGKSFFILKKDGTSKKVEIEVDLTHMNRFSNGLAPFRDKNKRFGLINTAGEVVIEPTFLSVGFFKNGIAWAKNEDKKTGYINTKGEWIIEPTFLAAKNIDPQTGFARVRDESGWFFISKTGKELRVEDVITFGDFHEGIAWARNSEKKIGFIDAKGQWIIQPKFIHVRNFSAGYCIVKEEEGLWGVINTKGEWTIKPTLVKVKNFKLVN